jgi:hypothetical protein
MRLNLSETAQFLRLSPDYIRKMVWEQEIAAYQVDHQLFFIKSDLLSYLFRNRSYDWQLAAASLLCGNCFQPILAADQIGCCCSTQNCLHLLCQNCLSQGVHECAIDVRRNKEKEGRSERNDILKQLRWDELWTISRFDSCLREANQIVLPATNTILRFGEWEKVKSTGDFRQYVACLQGISIHGLDTTIFPLNPYLHYDLDVKGTQIGIILQMVNRLEKLARYGYDDSPMGLHEIVQWVSRSRSKKNLVLTALASSAGWDEQAVEYVEGSKSNSDKAGYIDPWIGIYLVDIRTRQVFYNHRDPKTSSNSELFNLQSRTETIEEVTTIIKRILIFYDSVTSEELVTRFGFSNKIIDEAFFVISAEGRFEIQRYNDMGQVLIRKI